jgi:hypothetical protein
MSYREENGSVILTMSRLDYSKLMEVFAIASVSGTHDDWPINTEVVKLMNRLNQGNPNYTLYQVK